MPQQIERQAAQKFLTGIFRPAITTWNRLEGRPRREDFDRSLRAEVRDPLWMIARQWQVGEFEAGDNGSAVKAKTQLATARVNRYAGPSRLAAGYGDLLPLEIRVEREAVNLDLMTRARMGRHWLGLLAPVGIFEDLYLGQYGFVDPPSNSEAEAHLRSDQKAWQMMAALQGRFVDGGRLLDDILSEPNEHETWLDGEISNATVKGQILDAAADFVDWFRRVYNQPEPDDEPVWVDSYLEYQFACAAPADEQGESQTVMVAEQYHHGHLDWYSFNIDANAHLEDKEGSDIPPDKLVVQEPISFIPNQIEYGGMPNVRWWEFEDRKTDFGDIRPSTSELATLMLAEFALIYGNDWSLVPYDLDVGTLAQVFGVVVTDVFGVRTLVRPASDTSGEETDSWGLYHLNKSEAGIDTRLFLPPATPVMLESQPLERVILARDEMANMVWGIEHTLPSLAGGGTDGYELAKDLEQYLLAQADGAEPAVPIETEAKIRYRLGTRVTENWIPFIPVHKPGQNRDIRLQRAAMPRLIQGTPDLPVEPRGAILRPGLDETPKQPYFVNEEEAPQAGAVTRRSYQRTRWLDGRIYTWLGRQKLTGLGQGFSGLEFDRIVPME
jgi:hypothetical protein